MKKLPVSRYLNKGHIIMLGTEITSLIRKHEINVELTWKLPLFVWLYFLEE